MSLQHAGILAGVVAGGAATIGGLFSGWLTDRLVVRDRQWLLGVPILGQGISLLCMLLYLFWPSHIAFEMFGIPVPTALLWCTLAGFFTVWWVAPLLNLLTQMVSPWERATAVALQTICTTVAGVGLGPLFIGMVSDALQDISGNESLRYALVLSTLAVVVGLLLLLRLYRQGLLKSR